MPKMCGVAKTPNDY